MGHVKATRWLDCRKFFLEKFGPDAHQKIMEALTAEDRGNLSKPIIPITWLNYATYLNYIFAADRVLGKGDGTLVRESSVYTANQHFKGIYRMFVSLTSPAFVARKSTQVWRQYFDVGDMEVAIDEDKHFGLKLTNYPDIPLKHDHSHTPFMETILQISGAKNPKGCHPKCMARGDDHCLWEFRWE